MAEEHLKILSKVSIVVSAMEDLSGFTTPAELTRMWTEEPNVCSAASKRDRTWLGSDTSARTTAAEPGAAELIWAATASASAALEAET